MNLQEIRAAIGERRSQLMSSYIDDNHYLSSSQEDYFKNDSTLQALIAQFKRVLSRTPKSER